MYLGLNGRSAQNLFRGLNKKSKRFNKNYEEQTKQKCMLRGHVDTNIQIQRSKIPAQCLAILVKATEEVYPEVCTHPRGAVVGCAVEQMKGPGIPSPHT